MLLEKLSQTSFPPVCEDSFAVAMTSGRCESRKLYVARQLGAWTGNFRNDQNFGNVDACEGFRPLNSPKSLAGAISMLCGAPQFISHDS